MVNILLISPSLLPSERYGEMVPRDEQPLVPSNYFVVADLVQVNIFRSFTVLDGVIQATNEAVRTRAMSLILCDHEHMHITIPARRGGPMNSV